MAHDGGMNGVTEVSKFVDALMRMETGALDEEFFDLAKRVLAKGPIQEGAVFPDLDAMANAGAARVMIAFGQKPIGDSDSQGEVARKRMNAYIIRIAMRERYAALLESDYNAWADFLMEDVGMTSAALATFKGNARSPFSACLITLTRIDKDATVGDVVEYFGKVTANEVCTQPFFSKVVGPEGNRKGHYVFAATRIVSERALPKGLEWSRYGEEPGAYESDETE